MSIEDKPFHLRHPAPAPLPDYWPAPTEEAATALAEVPTSVLSESDFEAGVALQGRIYDDVPLADYIAHGHVATPDPANPIVGAPPFEPLGTTHAWSKGIGWLRWDSKKWAAASDEAVTEAVRVRVRAMYMQEAGTASKPSDLNAMKPLLSANKVRAVLGLLRGLLEVDAADFDTHPDLLNCQNGVVDLRTGELLPHDPAYRFTKITKGRYGLNTSHQDWSKTLQALPEDVADYMQVRYGQALTGHMSSDDKMPIQQGGGRNAKSTLVNAIMNAAGTFAGAVPEDVLTAGANAHPTGMMTLRGLRLAVIEELPEGRQLPTKRLKDLQGTQQITARFMRQDFVTFQATHSLFVNTNYIPKVAETDSGTWRRLLLVKFPFTYVTAPDVILDPTREREGDPGLRGRLERGDSDVWDAVLFWAVQGAVRWYEDGQTMPPMPLSVAADTQAWREDADLILAYTGSRLSFDPASAVTTAELYQDFTLWLSMSGHPEWSQETFSNRFESHAVVERANISRGVTRQHANISRLGGPMFTTSLPAQVRVWHGVKFDLEKAA